MKYIQVYVLFLMFVFQTSFGQNQTNVPEHKIRSETKDFIKSPVPDSVMRKLMQDRNGNILIASCKCVFRYDARLPACAGSNRNEEVGQEKTVTDFKSTASQKSQYC